MTDPSAPGPSPEIDIVIAAYDAAATLGRVLDAAVAAVAAAGHGRGHVLVVDAGSGDGTGELARERGVEVLRLERRAGPAAARNAGAHAATAPTLFFVDADCVLHADAVARVRAAFAADSELVAVSGSYDDRPPEPGFFSQYMNLRHHLTHQRARRDTATFWSGCGAVRRDAFLAAGGFDAARYDTPQIEDIELGLRLRRGGARLRLDPELQVTHLKRWTLASALHTDLWRRALPWSELILEHGELPSDLNLRRSERLAAALALPALVAVTALPVAALAGSPIGVVAALLPVAASLLANRDLVRLFANRRGLAFALGGWLFHQVHLVIAAGAFAAAALRRPRAAGALLRAGRGQRAAANSDSEAEDRAS